MAAVSSCVIPEDESKVRKEVTVGMVGVEKIPDEPAVPTKRETFLEDMLMRRFLDRR